MAISGLSDRIRVLVSERYVQPAVRAGSDRLSIRVKDILDDVAGDPDARGRTPAICEVLRAIYRVESADAINLACASAAGIDLFLTGDKKLVKFAVPGVLFISNFETAPL